jgi:hypothetical protein
MCFTNFQDAENIVERKRGESKNEVRLQTEANGWRGFQHSQTCKASSLKSNTLVYSRNLQNPAVS